MALRDVLRRSTRLCVSGEKRRPAMAYLTREVDAGDNPRASRSNPKYPTVAVIARGITLQKFRGRLIFNAPEIPGHT